MKKYIFILCFTSVLSGKLNAQIQDSTWCIIKIIAEGMANDQPFEMLVFSKDSSMLITKLLPIYTNDPHFLYATKLLQGEYILVPHKKVEHCYKFVEERYARRIKVVDKSLYSDWYLYSDCTAESSIFYFLYPNEYQYWIDSLALQKNHLLSYFLDYYRTHSAPILIRATYHNTVSKQIAIKRMDHLSKYLIKQSIDSKYIMQILLDYDDSMKDYVMMVDGDIDELSHFDHDKPLIFYFFEVSKEIPQIDIKCSSRQISKIRVYNPNGYAFRYKQYIVYQLLSGYEYGISVSYSQKKVHWTENFKEVQEDKLIIKKLD